ncbi:MAG: methionine--tRNA ligase subunit beta [Terriglobia bacterium]
MKKFYLTTPIYYPNARPHVGSAYTTIACDAIARYKRMCGYDVAFLTGTDEHGEKLQRAADAVGIPVEQFVGEKRELFKDLWRTLGIGEFRDSSASDADVAAGLARQGENGGVKPPLHPIKRLFVHTSQNLAHKAAVHWMIRQADKAGTIEKKKYEGRYCIFDERYVSDSPEPVNCDICGRPAELVSEENYFFKLSAFQDRLLKHYEDHPEFVLPDFRMNEVKSFVKSGLRDISISRRRLKWGIPWPDDPDQVVYVWYDALTSYLSGMGFEGEKRSHDFEKYWPADLHMIGKDILRFHAVYWPAFLWAAGLELPTTIFAHGWIYYEQDKMSKSKGNVVYPEPIIKAFEEFGAPGNDALRYYLLRDTPLGLDGSFSYAGLVDRYNFDLANDFGNLANRTITMIDRYCEGRIPIPVGAPSAAEERLKNASLVSSRPGAMPWHVRSALLQAPASVISDEKKEILRRAHSVTEENSSVAPDYFNYRALMNTFNIPSAILGAWDGISQVNGYLVDQQPWKLAESTTREDRRRLEWVLFSASDLLRLVAIMLYPVIPESAIRLWEQLGCSKDLGPIDKERIDQLQWGEFKPGTRVGKPEPIFPRLDKEKTLARLHELAEEDRAADTNSKEASTQVESQPEQKAAPQGATAPNPEARTANPVIQTPNPEPRIPNPEPQKITIDDFAKIDLRVGTILSAEPIPGATKLLKLQVDIGTEVRQVCAGIAEYYKPEQLVGMKIVLVANLQPRKLRGVESNGMIVAASVGEEGKPVLVTFREEVPNGAKLR